MSTKSEKRVIVALDYPEPSLALEFVEKLSPSLCRLKIGKELFTIAGPQFVRQVVAKGFDVFLDLKFHDIPNTVVAACRAASDLGVWMVNVHASGGSKMMEAARTAIQSTGADTKLIAVTVLTSMGDEDLIEIGVHGGAQAQVLKLAQLSSDSGMDGVVCSAQEATLIKDKVGSDFLTVTPGIRLAGGDAGDQKRIMTPVAAINNGADYLVIGRSITKAEDPNAILTNIIDEINSI